MTRNKIILLALGTAAVIGVGAYWYKKGNPFARLTGKSSTPCGKMDEIVYASGPMQIGGQTRKIIAFSACGKYYSRSQPQCITTPCNPVDTEINETKFYSIKKDQSLIK